MNIDKLTEVFVKLEAESSRNEMTKIISDFIQLIPDTRELKIVINLLQGQADLDKLNVGESLILDALITISGYDKAHLKERLVKLGDAGSLAEEVLKKKAQSTLFNSTKSVSIETVYNRMRDIGEISGNKAKIRSLEGLFNSVSPTTTKYVIRSILGILRLGVSSKTILDALALGIAGDKSHKEDIENAYNVMPSAADVAEKLKDEGMEKISSTDVEYNTPVRPMLASRFKPDEIMEKMGERCFAEYKLDGERAQIHVESEEIKKEGPEDSGWRKHVKIFSRQLTDITEQYPDIVEIVKQNLNARHCILDGEIVAYKNGKMLPFQTLMKRKRKHGVKEAIKEVPTKLYLFDVLKLGDKTQLKTPYMLRRDILGGLFSDDPEEIELVRNKQILGNGQLISFLNEARKSGYEGIVVKNDTSEYVPNKRGNDWIKLKGIEGTKMLDTIDLVIIGGYHGMGRRAEMAGAFLCAVKEGDKYVAFVKVGSGLTDDDMKNLSELTESLMLNKQPHNVFTYQPPEVWIEPKIVIELGCDEITKVLHNGDEVFSARFPVYMGIRQDKSPSEATTLDEIKELFLKQ